MGHFYFSSRRFHSFQIWLEKVGVVTVNLFQVTSAKHRCCVIPFENPGFTPSIEASLSFYLLTLSAQCLAAAKLLGTFVPPAVFLKLLLDHLTSPSSPSHPWVPLMVLAAVLDGCPGPLLAPHLALIADALVEPDVCQEYQQVSKQSDRRPAAGVNPLRLLHGGERL